MISNRNFVSCRDVQNTIEAPVVKTDLRGKKREISSSDLVSACFLIQADIILHCIFIRVISSLIPSQNPIVSIISANVY